MFGVVDFHEIIGCITGALEVVKLLCPQGEITYKESTASILAVYPPENVNSDSLKPLIPLLLKIEPKVRFYTPKKKTEILAGIKAIKIQILEMKKNKG